MTGIFDSHAHYYDERFEELPGGADALLAGLPGEGVSRILNVATSPENTAAVLAQAARWPFLYAAVGIHPTDGQALADPAAAIGGLDALLRDKKGRQEQKIVALGEIGLDYHYPDTDREKQALFFEAQLALAGELALPVIIHDREAHGDTFAAVCRHPGVQGVFHSYSGSAEMARDLIRRGWYLSFSGVVTYKNARHVREAAALTPPDRILVETDCPYLPPVPHRGEINHSGYLSCTLAVLAEVCGCTTEEMARRTAQNASRLFGVTL